MEKLSKVLLVFICILILVIAIISAVFNKELECINWIKRFNSYAFDTELTQEDLNAEIVNLQIASRQYLPFTHIPNKKSQTYTHWCFKADISTNKSVVVSEEDNIALTVVLFERMKNYKIIDNVGICPGVKLIDFIEEFQFERKRHKYNLFSSNCHYLILKMRGKFGGCTKLKHYSNGELVKQICSELTHNKRIHPKESGMVEVRDYEMYNKENKIVEKNEEYNNLFDIEQLFKLPDNII